MKGRKTPGMQPIIASENYHSASLRDWHSEFSFIYGLKDEKRSLQTMWLMVVEDASQVGEGIRTNEYAYALDRIAHTFCWVVSFLSKTLQPRHVFPAAKLGFAFADDVLWQKYPGVCYRCLKYVCTCQEQETERRISEWKSSNDPRLEELPRLRAQLNSKPTNLAGWSELLGRIYGPSHARQSVNEIAFHFLEEVGEVARALRELLEYAGTLSPDAIEQPNHESRLLKLHIELFAEVADTLSWMFSLTTKISSELHGAANVITQYTSDPQDTSLLLTMLNRNLPVTLASAVWNAYRCKDHDCVYCPKCRKRPCGCSILEEKTVAATF